MSLASVCRPIGGSQITTVQKGRIFVQHIFGHAGLIEFGHVAHVATNGALDGRQCATLVRIGGHSQGAASTQYQDAFAVTSSTFSQLQGDLRHVTQIFMVLLSSESDPIVSYRCRLIVVVAVVFLSLRHCEWCRYYVLCMCY
jgi:hypothetical protein